MLPRLPLSRCETLFLSTEVYHECFFDCAGRVTPERDSSHYAQQRSQLAAQTAALLNGTHTAAVHATYVGGSVVPEGNWEILSSAPAALTNAAFLQTCQAVRACADESADESATRPRSR